MRVLVTGGAGFLGKKLARELKAHCGSGGSLKQDRIEIQGDRRAQVKALLEERRFQVKLAGG